MDIEGNSFVSIVRIYKLPILLGSISFLLIVVSIVLLVKSSYSSEPIQFLDRQNNVLGDISNKDNDSASTTKIRVDIEGAVVNSGVVTVPLGSRVEDVLESAGGLRHDADTDYIAQSMNKAMKVSDGMKIYIPSKNEMSHNNGCTGSGCETSHNKSILLQRPDGQSQNIGGVGRVSINMASKEQLDTLTGIGPVTAQKIIDNRPYQTLEELVSKKAVGQSVFEKIKEQIDL